MDAARKFLPHDYPDELLEWFAGTGAPLSERALKMGSLDFHHFSSILDAVDGRRCSTHGQSLDRKTAAVKCVAEYIERKVMVDYFERTPMSRNVPKGLRNSNGWAVHFDSIQAQSSARREALERHLLLKSFLAHGWNGLRLVEKIEGDELSLYFLVSTYSHGGIAAGLVAARSPLYPGVAFGYCAGPLAEVGRAPFWENALFESVGKIKTLAGRPIDISLDPNSWILQEMKRYLEEPFDWDLLGKTKFDGSFVEDELDGMVTETFDLAPEVENRFPFFGAYSRGGNLIPLYHLPDLSPEGLVHLKAILRTHGIESIPERHPIL